MRTYCKSSFSRSTYTLIQERRLCHTSDARSDAVALLPLHLCVWTALRRHVRSRSHQTHITQQNVDQLRQVVNVGAANEPPQSSNARIPGRASNMLRMSKKRLNFAPHPTTPKPPAPATHGYGWRCLHGVFQASNRLLDQ